MLMDVMGDCNGMDFLSLNVLNYDEIDPDLWAYWTSTGKILKKNKQKTHILFYDFEKLDGLGCIKVFPFIVDAVAPVEGCA